MMCCFAGSVSLRVSEVIRIKIIIKYVFLFIFLNRFCIYVLFKYIKKTSKMKFIKINKGMKFLEMLFSDNNRSIIL